MCQTAEPVKPFTWVTPSLAAARAVSFIRSAARCLDARRVAVAPDLWRQDPLVARVDRVAHRLADEMRAEREAVQMVALEHLLDRRAVAVLGERAVDLEVVAPAGELEPVEAPLARSCAASSSSGRSAHWPVKRVTGLAITSILRRVGFRRARRRLRRRPHARRAAPRGARAVDARPLPVAVRQHQLHRRRGRQRPGGVRPVPGAEGDLGDEAEEAGELRPRLGPADAELCRTGRCPSVHAAATSARCASTPRTSARRWRTAGPSTWARFAAPRRPPASRAGTGPHRRSASGSPARAS